MTTAATDKKTRATGTQAQAVRRRTGPTAAPIRVIAAALSGTMVFCAFPDFRLHALIWIGLVPLMLALDGTRRALSGFALGWIAGTVTNLGGFYWMSYMLEEFGHLPPWGAWTVTVLNAAWQGLVFALFGYLYVRLRRPGLVHRLVAVPSLMVLCEAAVPYVFPWYLSNGLQPQTEVFQIVELIGVPAASAVVVAVNALLARAVRDLVLARRVPFMPAFLAAVVFGSAFGFGALRVAHIDSQARVSPTLGVGMVEADVGIWEKESRGLDATERQLALRANLLKHQVLSAEAAEEGAELIVWPESSYMPFQATGIKRSDVFGLLRTKDDRLLIRTPEGQFVSPTSMVGGEIFTDVDGRIRAVVGAREDNAMVLVRGGRIFRLRPEGWREELSGVALNLNAGWAGTYDAFRRTHVRALARLCADAEGPCDLPAVAVGDGGTWLRRVGGRWERGSSPTDQDLLAVAGLWAGDLFAVGTKGVLLRDDGREVKQLREGGPTLRAVAAERSGRVAAVGDDCTVLIADGVSGIRTVEVEGCSERLRAVAFLPGGRLVAGGRGGTLLYEVARGGPIRHRVLPDEAYVRSLQSDPWGRLAAGLGDGRILDLSEPSRPGLPLLAQVGQEVFRYAHVGFLTDRAIPDDTRHIYASPRPLPEGGSYRQRARRDASSSALDRDAVQRGFSTHLLFGAISYDAAEVLGLSEPVDKHLRNSVVLLDPRGRVQGMSHKIRLLLFGEYLPFEDLIPALRDLVPEAGFFREGDAVRLLSMKLASGKTRRIAPLVCYEDIIPEFGRILGPLRHDLLINVTNDAWFGHTSEPALHLQLAAARAVESRRMLVRSTNTGISAFIDPAGRILDQTSLSDPEIRVRKLPMIEAESWHGIVERVAFWTLLLWAVLLVIADIVRAAPRLSGR